MAAVSTGSARLAVIGLFSVGSLTWTLTSAAAIAGASQASARIEGGVLHPVDARLHHSLDRVEKHFDALEHRHDRSQLVRRRGRVTARHDKRRPLELGDRKTRVEICTQ